MTMPILVHADSSTLLSSHGAIALSRCSGFHGSILKRLVPDQGATLNGPGVSAAQRAARPVQTAALAKKSGTTGKGILHGSLAEEHPDLAQQWALESNGSVTPESVAAASAFKAAWRCGQECEHCGMPHEWIAKVANRTLLGTGCPLCSGNQVCRCRSMAAMHPGLMKEWDWEGNMGTDPYSVSCCSKIKVFWVCAEHGHWDATPDGRLSQGSGCPKCARQARLGQSFRRAFLKDELPDVYAELHPTKNAGVDMEKLNCGSGKRVWWLCQSNHNRPEGCQHEHKWEAQITNRCKSTCPVGCPFCSGISICPCKSLAELQPALLQYWDVAGNAFPFAKPVDPARLGAFSNKKVWWQHECGDGQVCHWTARIHVVVKSFKATGRVPCPNCGVADRIASFAERRRQLIKRS